MESKKYTNRLINEASPYLLQHAHNPVDWYPWGEEAWELARKENKPVIVSIGYSACHWCHVMEHESFEDEDIAAIMNEFFVCIKVDREERPDIDNVYMEAVQLMTGRGGWPLNCITLPDGKPIYGGTYFPREAWAQVLKQLHDVYINNHDKALDYSEHLLKGLIESESIKSGIKDQKSFDSKKVIYSFIQQFDHTHGGSQKVPKFVMPCNYRFLLDYGILQKHDLILDHVLLTLQKITRGGINDQLGGGFARYSVDELWKVPHFEKMLYDNGQLISLYALAYGHYKEHELKETVLQTIQFCVRELKNEDGIYCSAIDADSEGVEGKFYAWTEKEIEEILNTEEYNFAKTYYSLNENGYWEHDQFILLRQYDDESIMKFFGMSNSDFYVMRENVREKLLQKRNERIRPGLDDKCILGWNSTLLEGLAHSAIYIDAQFYAKAKNLYENMKKCFFADGRWYRIYKNKKASIGAFSEDLSLLASALYALYEVDCDTFYLDELKGVLDILQEDFYLSENGLFQFTSRHAEKLIVSRTEIFDNVIPSGNSILCRVLFQYGTLVGKESYIEQSAKMLNQTKAYFENAHGALGNWLVAWLYAEENNRQIVITGEQAHKALLKERNTYQPAVTWLAANMEWNSPLLTSRFSKDKTMIFDCINKACNLPKEFKP